MHFHHSKEAPSGLDPAFGAEVSLETTTTTREEWISSHCTGNKKALLIGINYSGTDSKIHFLPSTLRVLTCKNGMHQAHSMDVTQTCRGCISSLLKHMVFWQKISSYSRTRASLRMNTSPPRLIWCISPRFTKLSEAVLKLHRYSSIGCNGS